MRPTHDMYYCTPCGLEFTGLSLAKIRGSYNPEEVIPDA